jgi:glycosyltransferase involved in cell wall biosynthesis
VPKKLLILTYEFPPDGGGGVQRLAKFARYLPDSGWEPVVVAAEHRPGRPLDPTLLQEVESVRVVRTPARQPIILVTRVLATLRRVRGVFPRRRRPRPGEAPASTNAPSPGAGEAPRSTEPTPPAPVPGRAARITALISSPDAAAFWIGPAVRAAVALGREEQVAAVLASGPPHSVLVAGARTAAALGVPLVADLRDAWRDFPGLQHPTRPHRSRALALERRVMGSAAAVTCVSQPIADEARQMGAKDVVVLPNGFDPADVPAWKPEPGDLRITFMGQMYAVWSDPSALLDGMILAAASSPAAARARFDVIGPEVPFAVKAVAARGLQDRVTFLGYRPHAEALRLLASADVGVMLVRDMPGARAVYTGKLFEYLGMGIPILLVGPDDGVAAALVREAGGSLRVVAYGDPDGCARALVELAEAKARGVRPPAPDPEVLRRFDRREQASVLATILDRVTAR